MDGKITYENENERLKDTSRCAGPRADLKMCLLASDCCKIVRRCQFQGYNIQVMHFKRYKKTPRECLKTRDGTVPDECYALKTTFYDCKHSLLDGRRRFRGPKGY